MTRLGSEYVVLRCVRCGRHPDQIEEYSPEYTGEDLTPEQFVWKEEGTLNTENGHFYCTGCFIEAGLPRGVAP